jgi:hypothetical protein
MGAMVHLGEEMEFFSPLHLLILLFSAFIIFGLPLLAVLLLVRWLNKWQQQRQLGARVSIAGVVIGGMTDVVSSSILGIPLVIYVMVKFDLLHAPGGSRCNHICDSFNRVAIWTGIDNWLGLFCPGRLRRRMDRQT